MGYKAWVMMSHLNQEKTETLLEMYPLITCKDCKYGEPMCKPWDDIVCTQNRATHCPDWYCADGEKAVERE